MFRVVHKNSMGLVINEDQDDIGCQPLASETDNNDKLREYIAASDIYTGDTLTIIEC